MKARSRQRMIALIRVYVVLIATVIAVAGCGDKQKTEREIQAEYKACIARIPEGGLFEALTNPHAYRVHRRAEQACIRHRNAERP